MDIALNMPDSPEPRLICTIKLCNGREAFLDAAVLKGYTPSSTPEDRGMAFYTQCTTTMVKHTEVLLNTSRLDIETVIHEVRHAYFWAVADKHHLVRVDLADGPREEQFCSRLDGLYDRAICAIEAELGKTLKWKVL